MITADRPLDGLIPEVPIGDVFEAIVTWAKNNLGPLVDTTKTVVESMTSGLSDLLLLAPPIVMVVLFAGLGLWLRGWKFGLGVLIAMGLVSGLPYWEQTMQTLAQVLVASALALVVAVPIGILAAENRRFSVVVRPVLDFMQTMPAFVYLIPAVSLYSIGVVPGVLATVVFCMPPGVRLTELGLRQVDKEVVEAGESFGASPAAILGRIKLPLAMPTIMAGVNQVIMLALSMVVIAGMVGAEGLGSVIKESVDRLLIGKGFTAGAAVVVLAIFLDRLTDALGSRTRVAKAKRLTSHV